MLSSDQTNRSGQKYTDTLICTRSHTQQLLYKYAEIYLKLCVRLCFNDISDKRESKQNSFEFESTFGKKWERHGDEGSVYFGNKVDLIHVMM